MTAYDTPEQIAAFDVYIKQNPDGRQVHHTGTLGYEEDEWSAFQAGWTAAVQAEREACAEHYLGIMRKAIAEEREACAKFCETNQVWVGQGKRGFSQWGEEDFVEGGRHQGMDYAAAIRARGGM